MNHTKRVLSALLATALLVLSGCGRTEEDTQPATGRYVEEQLAIPGNLAEPLLFDQKTDGTLVLLAVTQTATRALWESSDDGDTWSEITAPWLDDLADIPISNVALGPDDRIYIEYIDPEMPYSNDRAGSSETVDDQEEAPNIPNPIAVVGDGGLEVLPFHYAASSSDSFYYYASEFLLDESGDYIINYFVSIVMMDGQTGEKRMEILDIGETLYEGAIAVSDRMVAIPDGDDYLIYSTGDGSELMRVDGAPRVPPLESVYYMFGLKHGHRVATFAKDGQSLYFCDASGLYRTIFGSHLTECLMGGEQSSLRIPTMIPRRLLELDNLTFLVLGTNGAEGCVLYRYRFDENVLTVPNEQITVYSLRENPTVRQAIGVFQRDNPQVRVVYIQGLTGNDAITMEDALRALSTEILAGKGPDVLVLDGLPIDSYIEKGVLTDLGPVFDVGIANGDYLRHVADTYRSGDALRAIPARVSYPMLLGTEEAVSSIQSLETLVAWLEGQEDIRLTTTAPRALLKHFYPVYSPRLIDSGSRINETELSAFLDGMRRLANMEGIRNSSTSEENFDLLFDAGYWRFDHAALCVSYLDSLYNSASVDSAIAIRGEGAFAPLPNGDGATYIPSTIMGVNTGSEKQELATEFVCCVLSSLVLANNFDDGLPVNYEALRQNMVNPRPNENEIVSLVLGFDSYFDVIWPEEAFFTELIAVIEEIDQPACQNASLEQIVITEGLQFLTGNATLQDTVASVIWKADLMLLE